MTDRLMTLLLPGLIWNRELYGRMLSRYVNSSTKWLDVGCGRWLLGPALEAQEQALRSVPEVLVGVDVDTKSMLENRFIHSLACADVVSQPFRDASFDLISSNMVLEHVADPESAFAEFSRLLKLHGRLVVHTPNTWNYAIIAVRTVKTIFPQAVVSRLAAWADGRAPDDIFQTYYRANSRRRLRELAANHGLEEETSKVVVGPQPIMKHFAPLALVEICWMRLLLTRLFEPLATSIIGVYKKL